MTSILSHRGWWTSASERNTLNAFRRSFDAGFGTETDFRDLDGELVISHDPPRRGALLAREFFELYRERGQGLPLALNIKADGIQDLMVKLLAEYSVENYFVFDMAVPDGLGYLNRNLKTFTRQSEVEPHPAFLEKAHGVWIDEFYGHWVDESVIRGHLSAGRRVCLVSPDLHRRPIGAEWDHYRKLIHEFGSMCLLCTDFPNRAKDVIYG